jgi:hypothetical protein
MPGISAETGLNGLIISARVYLQRTVEWIRPFQRFTANPGNGRTDAIPLSLAAWGLEMFFSVRLNPAAGIFSSE